MKRLVFFIIFLSIISNSLHPQVKKRIRRDDLTVRVQATVTKLPGEHLRFDYAFENGVGSHQSMSIAVVELNDEWEEYGGSVRNVVPPREKDWGQYPDVGEKMRWRAQYDTTGLDFLERAPRSAILPGERLSFSFEAKGLPGIGSYWAEGWAPWFFTQEEEDSLIAEGYDWEKSRAIDENFFKGTTIVRRSPPAVFNALIFLDTLISYKHQAFALGWIKNQGIVTSLDAKLDNAKRQLQRGNTTAAKNILQALVNEVEALWKGEQHPYGGKQLTSEAYALLKFNAEYLISKL